MISRNFSPSARRYCRDSPVCKRCGLNSTGRGGNGRNNGGSPMTPNARPCARGRIGTRSNSSNSCNGRPTGSCGLAGGSPANWARRAGSISMSPAGCNAAGLEIQSFEPYREMLRASMRYAGAIRLDHVLGLKRLYLVPHGFTANNGVYVQMPFEALLAATAQESMKHRCVVIGEDLGTVPEGFREKMAEWGIWSYLVMMFERDRHGSFQGLDHYAPNALVTFNTHDLPTFAGWRTCGDL